METSNAQILDELLGTRGIALQRSELFDSMPPHSNVSPDWDRVEGMMLGLAIGDSLGNTTESQVPADRHRQHGTIRDYMPDLLLGGPGVGLPSDDTQLAYWTLEQMLEDDGLIPDNLARRFCQDRIVGIGHTIWRFIQGYAREGRPWHKAGIQSAGNGALMRIAPVLVPYASNPSPDLWTDTALAAMITHNDPTSIGACLAFVHLLSHALSMTRPPQPEWWVETFCSVLEPIEGRTRCRSRSPQIPYTGPLWSFTQAFVTKALEDDMTVEAACNWWHSGAYLFETVPSVLYILCKCAHDPEGAIVRAVNDTWDNDTIASIVGAAVGALHGKRALPKRWIDGLSGRTSTCDDGRVFELLGQARGKWMA